MDFTYSEEQQMLADSLRRFVDTEYTFTQRRNCARGGGGFGPPGCGRRWPRWACWD
ncbi:hypothetical protein ACU4GD_31035 [Cupriavidus basilensis]